MKLHGHSLKLVAAVMGLCAIMGGSGLAHAQPEPSPPPAPSIIDQLITTTPALSVDPGDEGDQSIPWGGVGMFCQNLFVRCR
jgi:hypothetical protein